MASLLILASCATKEEKNDDFDYTVESCGARVKKRDKITGFFQFFNDFS